MDVSERVVAGRRTDALVLSEPALRPVWSHGTESMERSVPARASLPCLSDSPDTSECRRTGEDVVERSFRRGPSERLFSLNGRHWTALVRKAQRKITERAERERVDHERAERARAERARARWNLDSGGALLRAVNAESGGSEEENAADEDTYAQLHPGRSLRTDIVGPHRGCTQCVAGRECRYTVDVLDAKGGTELEACCRVFLVPPQRAEEWLFSSIQGQWQVVADSKAGRLIMVAMVGNDHDNDISHVKDDISPLVTRFLPLDCRTSGAIEYLTQENRIKFRRTLALIESSTTGSMLVEDVAVAPRKSKCRKTCTVELTCYRRLSFRRNPNMIQSEALLVREGVAGNRKSRKRCKGGHVKGNSASQRAKAAVLEGLNIDYSFLTSEYHEAMIAAFVLIETNMMQWQTSKVEIRVMILGLGAGLLPMFVHNHVPVNDIQVVELDEIVGKIAKNHFGFLEDKKMKLQIGDGVVAVKAIADAAPSKSQSGPGSTDCRLHVLIVDTDSKDPSNGLSCPAPECLEDSFLLAARQALLDGGMMIVNVVARARKFHVHSKAKLKRFFAEVYEIDVDEDANWVLIAMAQPSDYNEKVLSEQKKICARVASWGPGPNLQKFIRSIERVK